ncbi:MAG: sigma-70 family RNA polymerase sigma factor [Candidatus Aenigmarchaeota archaeon]|nr:sigma-70 family RNA polymerase sigma factor [Candidatus Aenigmarchaeota archaeon]
MNRDNLKEKLRCLTPNQKRIIRILVHYDNLTTNEIAGALGLDWRTAKSHLIKLKNLGLVGRKNIMKKKTVIINTNTKSGTRKTIVKVKKTQWKIKLSVADKM